MSKRPAFPLGIEMQLLSEQNESNLLAKVNYSKSFQIRSPQVDYYCPSTNDRKQFSFEKKNEFVRQFTDNMLENVRKINKLTSFHLHLIGDLGGSEEFNLRRKSSFSFQQFNYEQKRFFSELKESILNQWEKLPLIYPDNAAKMIWDVIAVVARLYFLYIIPIDLAWVQNQFIFHDYFGISIVFLLLLLSDMILSLNTVYFKNGEAVKSRKAIIKHSLYNTYGLQWLSVFQLLIYFIVNSYHHISLDVDNQLVNLGLLIFLVHHKTIITYATSYEEGLNLSKQTSSVLALFKHIAFLFYVIHLLSCFWYWTGHYSIHNYEGKSWVTQTNMQEQTFNIQYLQAFYYIAVTIFTVGYGDVTPQSSLEKVVSILLIMVSSIQLPFSVNTVGKIITEMTAFSEEKKRKLRIINSYMKQNGTSSGLQVQVRKYLSYFWENIVVSQSDEEKQIIDSLSEFLREQLVSEAHQNIFNQCTLFKIRFSDQFKKQLIKEVEEVLLSPEQELKSPGDIVLYFIEEGSIQVCLQQGRKISFGTVNKGASIGLKNFIIGVQALESYKSVGFTKAMILKRENFMKIMQEYPDDYELFCSIRDQLIFNKGEQIFPVKCFSCQSYQHKLIDCPLVTYVPDKEFLLKQYLYPKQQTRLPCNRIQKKHNTLAYNRKLLDQCALLIQNEQPPLMQIYKFDNILNIDEDQFRRQVKKTQSVHQFAQVQERKRVSKKIVTLLEVEDPVKKKFRFLVNKLIQMNKFYPAFLIQTYGKFEKMIEQRNVNNILLILEQRIKNINSLNNHRFDPYISDIQFIISRLQTKSYIDDAEFECPKNFKLYFRNNNFSKVKQKNYQKSFTILKKFIYYVQFPGQVIRKYNLKQIDLYWQINRRRQNICVSALPLTT